MNKTVYNKQNGKEITLDKSDICPISKNWLIPANCTEKEPPKVEEGYKVFFENNEWHIEKTEEQEQKEETQKYKPIVKSIQEQIEELKAEIEELKLEKEEVKKNIASARAEALELSNLILKKGADENGLESDMGNSSI